MSRVFTIRYRCNGALDEEGPVTLRILNDEGDKDYPMSLEGGYWRATVDVEEGDEEAIRIKDGYPTVSTTIEFEDEELHLVTYERDEDGSGVVFD